MLDSHSHSAESARRVPLPACRGCVVCVSVALSFSSPDSALEDWSSLLSEIRLCLCSSSSSGNDWDVAGHACSALTMLRTRYSCTACSAAATHTETYRSPARLSCCPCPPHIILITRSLLSPWTPTISLLRRPMCAAPRARSLSLSRVDEDRAFAIAAAAFQIEHRP